MIFEEIEICFGFVCVFGFISVLISGVGKIINITRSSDVSFERIVFEYYIFEYNIFHAVQIKKVYNDFVDFNKN